MNDFGAASLEELQTLLEPGTKFSPQDLVRIVEAKARSDKAIAKARSDEAKARSDEAKARSDEANAKARSDEAIAIMMNGMLVEHKLDFIRMKSRNNSGIK
jgi:uncharacterized protein YqfA (UPF0365 family)